MKLEEYKRFEDYELEHPLWDKLGDEVAELMHRYGPDRHVDGWDIITHFLLTNYNLTPKQSEGGDNE